MFRPKQPGNFWQDRRGGITAFTAVIFLFLFVAAGMGVDFMRHEAHRAELQDALDRGVLAAASLSQTMGAEETIRGYLKSTGFSMPGFNVDVSELTNLNTRSINATARFDMRTYFLKVIGIPSMTVAATGSAFESRQEIEISLALDISTSMSFETSGNTTRTRLDVMQDSASVFVDMMLTDATLEDVSFNLVPFAGQVNPGSDVYDYLRSAPVHAYSNCIDFEDVDYTYVEMPNWHSRDQTQYFSFSSYYTKYVRAESDAAATGATDDDGNNGHGNSGGYDPSNPGRGKGNSKPGRGNGTSTTTPDANSGAWGDNSNGLPLSVDLGWCPGDEGQVAYFSNDPDGLKDQIRNLRTHEGTGTQIAMKYAAMLMHPDAQMISADLAAQGDIDPNFRDRPHKFQNDDVLKVIVLMSDGDTMQQVRVHHHAYDSVWDREWWANNLPTSNDPYGYDDFYEAVSKATARSQLVEICTKAKSRGVTIFTIGFDVVDGSDAETDMRACASSPSHYYDVEGLELTDAFTAIASTVQKLKLTH